MNYGSITNPTTAAGRLYALLSASPGTWLDGWQLTMDARTTAIGTRVSEVRHQLPPGQHIEHSPRPTPGHVRGSWYRLVAGPQMELF